jgi:UDP-N-acetyl-2-amino-2-deoxyglucuronate dehydrogenase
MTPPKFILLGAAGYVAPRHMAAIKAVGGDLIAAVDPCDNVGILDHYFPKCKFYTNIYELNGIEADYCVICLPNHLHAASAMHAMRHGMNPIIEKPATISSKSLDDLAMVERATGKTCYCILQMRLHHQAQLMKETSSRLKSPLVDIQYNTPRGPWYWKSWKGDVRRSGGVLFNIGVHLIDLALWSFGSCLKSDVTVEKHTAGGVMKFENADIFMSLSINGNEKQRSFTVSSPDLDQLVSVTYDFTDGFDNLHAESYHHIMDGKGFGLEDARPAIELCERLSKDAA